MTVYLLDTTTLTHLQASHARLVVRYTAARHAGDSVETTSVNVAEVLAGWINRIRQARTPADEARYSGRLAESTRFLGGFVIHPVSVPALARVELLVKAKLNVGRADLKIAAVALEIGATVVTDNLRDFGRVPGLAVEDWLA